MMPSCQALITGGSSGIGAAIADKLAAAGNRLVAVASRTGARAVVADLCTPEGLTRAADVAADVDLLVNSAGVGWAGDLATMDQPDIDRLVTLNLTAPMRLTRAALPGMRARGRGHRVYVSSIA